MKLRMAHSTKGCAMFLRTVLFVVPVLFMTAAAPASSKPHKATELVTTSFIVQLHSGQPGLASVSVSESGRVSLLLQQIDPLNPYSEGEIVWSGSRRATRASIRSLLLDVRVLANAEIASTSAGVTCQSIDPFPYVGHVSVVRDYVEATNSFDGPLTEIHTEGLCEFTTTDPIQVRDVIRVQQLSGKISSLVTQLFPGRVRVVKVGNRHFISDLVFD